jgi:hypothetical protein
MSQDAKDKDSISKQISNYVKSHATLVFFIMFFIIVMFCLLFLSMSSEIARLKSGIKDLGPVIQELSNRSSIARRGIDSLINDDVRMSDMIKSFKDDNEKIEKLLDQIRELDKNGVQEIEYRFSEKMAELDRRVSCLELVPITVIEPPKPVKTVERPKEPPKKTVDIEPSTPIEASKARPTVQKQRIGFFKMLLPWNWFRRQ